MPPKFWKHLVSKLTVSFYFGGRGKMDTLLSILLITILGGVKLLSILPISNFWGW